MAQAHERGSVWAKRALVTIVVLVCLVGAWLLGAAFLPRWWSHRIADQANGSFTGGILVGLFYGFVFTLLPLLTGVGREHHGEILRQATRLADAGALIPRLDGQLYTLETANEAHSAVATNTASQGKVVISINEEQ